MGRATDRQRAVVLAGHTGDEALARAALGDQDPGVRAAAVGALGRCGTLTAGDLIAALADADATVRRRAAEEAARHPTLPSGPALLSTLADDDEGVLEAAVHALGELDPAPPGAAAAIAELVTGHGEVTVRETAVAALGSLGDEAGRAAVLAATTDVATVRRRAVLALVAFDGPDIEDALQRLATDRDRQVRQAAEDLLHGWGTSP